MDDVGLAYGSATELVEAMAAGQVSAVELAEAATLPGLPATALPIGTSDDGLPIGVQAIGPMNEDRTTIRFAELAEREFGGFTPPALDWLAA